MTELPLPSGPSSSRLWLVTGGAGFIGSHLVRALLEGGERVRVVDDFSTGKRERVAGFQGRAGFELVEGTIVAPDTCRGVMEGVTHVLHQAAIPSVARSVDDPLSTHHACATGTLNLLHAAQEAGVTRFVCAGSSSAYGNTPELPKHEAMATNPRSPYAVAKLAGEQYCRSWPELFGMETVVLRYFNVFGPGQDPDSFYSAVIPKFVRLALSGRAPEIHGDGEQTRDFTYIDNVVDANLRAASVEGARVSGRVFNVGCGERISVNRLWEEIARLTGAEVGPVYGPPRPGDVRDSLADVEALAEATGWRVGVGLEEGLGRTVESLRG
jgi:nucleoside-diphosphate-sugar epimerase